MSTPRNQYCYFTTSRQPCHSNLTTTNVGRQGQVRIGTAVMLDEHETFARERGYTGFDVPALFIMS